MVDILAVAGCVAGGCGERVGRGRVCVVGVYVAGGGGGRVGRAKVCVA